ncbi:MAG: R3H domain-containing nucleic acid-binding protein [Patescibacteria group bacterium]
MTKKEEKIIKDTTEELLKLLGIEGGIEINFGDEAVDIVLDTPDSGVVIGRHGDILESLQLVLSIVISKKLNRFLRISLEVGDYKKNREEWLKNTALDAKNKVMSQGREITLPELKAWERRIVHLALKDDEEVISESVGEGRDRVLIIRPK